MNTVIYFIRHSKVLSVKKLNCTDSIQIQNEKKVLSIEGEERAQILSKIKELQNIDLLISSNYARTVSTAKYIAKENNIDIFIDEDFGERRIGINNWREYPEDFEKKQFLDEGYKIGNGESKRDTTQRLCNSLIKLLNENKGKRIAIVFHSTAMLFLLSNWCEIFLKEPDYYVNFQNREIFKTPFNAPEVFELEFDENNKILSIKNIRPESLENEGVNETI